MSEASSNNKNKQTLDLKGTFKIVIADKNGNDIVPQSQVTDAVITIEKVSA